MMQNIVINVCEKFQYDRLRNDRALGNRKSDNNKNNEHNVRNHLGPVFGSREWPLAIQRKSYLKADGAAAVLIECVEDIMSVGRAV